jgi:hypothetical protein
LREWASMLWPQLCGRIRRKNFWMPDMGIGDCFETNKG